MMFITNIINGHDNEMRGLLLMILKSLLNCVHVKNSFWRKSKKQSDPMRMSQDDSNIGLQKPPKMTPRLSP